MTNEINYGDCWTYPLPKINEMVKNIDDISEEMEELQSEFNQIESAMEIKTGTFTPASGITLNEVSVKQQGNVVNIRAWVESATAISGDTVIGTVNGVDIPTGGVRGICSTGVHGYDANVCAYCHLYASNSTFHLLPAVNNHTNAVINLTYIV